MQSICYKSNAANPLTITLGELAAKTQTQLLGPAETLIKGVGAIAHAVEGDITFLAESKYTHFLATLTASAVIITKDMADNCKIPALVCEDPKLVFAQVSQLLHPFQTLTPEHHASAVIGEECNIHPQTFIGPHCVIGKRVTIEANVVIQAGCVIADDCIIGEGTLLYPRVTIYQNCRIGKDGIIHSGVVIGSDGFGFAKNKNRWLKVPQIGGVTIGDRVEIGANTTIDRGAIEDTVIGNDVILDNHIQIGHNVKIGDGTAMAACCGVAGSTTIGKNCLIGGGTRFNGHITLADKVIIIGCSNVSNSITKPGIHGSAITTMEMKLWKKNLARFHQLDNLALRLIDLERKFKIPQEG